MLAPHSAKHVFELSLELVLPSWLWSWLSLKAVPRSSVCAPYWYTCGKTPSAARTPQTPRIPHEPCDATFACRKSSAELPGTLTETLAGAVSIDLPLAMGATALTRHVMRLPWHARDATVRAAREAMGCSAGSSVGGWWPLRASADVPACAELSRIPIRLWLGEACHGPGPKYDLSL